MRKKEKKERKNFDKIISSSPFYKEIYLVNKKIKNPKDLDKLVYFINQIQRNYETTDTSFFFEVLFCLGVSTFAFFKNFHSLQVNNFKMFFIYLFCRFYLFRSFYEA